MSRSDKYFFLIEFHGGHIMSRGISTNLQVGNIIDCLSDNNIKFVCRYYSRTTKQRQKRLVTDEALALTKAGIDIVAIYEDGPTNAAYFSMERGIQDGASACEHAAQIGQPTGSAIYFAVDYDALASDVSGCIQQYFVGVRQGLTQQGNGGHYDIGVYGSGRVCRHIKEDQNLAKYSWLAESRGWSGHAAYAQPDISQRVAISTLCGLTPGYKGQYEDNFSDGQIGAFSSVGAPKAIPDTSFLQQAIPIAADAPSDFVREVAVTAIQQYRQYHQFDENQPELKDQIRAYWEELGLTFPGVKTPWSAVFVSWLMRKSGASANEFKASNAHSRFVFWAIENARKNSGLFRAHRLDDYAPKIGDIIQNNRNGQEINYDFASAHKAYDSHATIVVDIDADEKGRYALTVGGNESNSVRRNRISLHDNGMVAQKVFNPYICVIQNLR